MFKIVIVTAVVITVCAAVPAMGYDKGLGPYFGDKEDEDWLADYVANIPDGCDFIFCPEHIYWTKLQLAVPTPDPHEIASWFPEIIADASRDVYLGINLLSDDRTGLYTPIPSHVPISPPGPFASTTVRTAFADECLEIVDHAWESSGGRVAYIALVLEMDFYYYNEDTRGDYGNLIQAVIEARDTIKAEEDYADIPIDVYFTLNMLWVKSSGGTQPAIYTTIVADEDLNDEMDFLGASAYPMGLGYLFEDPGDIDEDYFDLALNATALPFHIPELGWSSEDVTFGNKTVESSPEEQDDFVDAYFGLELDVPLVIWFVPHDIKEGENTIPAKRPFATFKDMGLWEWDFSDDKPAWDTWLGY